ncbi:metal ABC transporter ATPase [Niallia oryzisoli]|uniref:Metal ABC transporter ATPase n=1 Tax=Niallia oryzisoli TaxID=1737571 RepID=A0ABZ2CPZ2_9BACI
MKDYILLNYIKQKLVKYDIKIVHFIPGRIRLQSLQWRTNKTLMETVIKELQAQSMIFSVQPTFITGSLVITYDTSYITNLQELDSWFRVLDQVYLLK